MNDSLEDTTTYRALFQRVALTLEHEIASAGPPRLQLEGQPRSPRSRLSVLTWSLALTVVLILVAVVAAGARHQRAGVSLSTNPAPAAAHDPRYAIGFTDGKLVRIDLSTGRMTPAPEPLASLSNDVLARLHYFVLITPVANYIVTSDLSAPPLGVPEGDVYAASDPGSFWVTSPVRNISPTRSASRYDSSGRRQQEVAVPSSALVVGDTQGFVVLDRGARDLAQISLWDPVTMKEGAPFGFGSHEVASTSTWLAWVGPRQPSGPAQLNVRDSTGVVTSISLGDASPFELSLSPDRLHLLLLGSSKAEPNKDVLDVVDVARRHVEPVPMPDGLMPIVPLGWSPDGQTAVFGMTDVQATNTNRGANFLGEVQVTTGRLTKTALPSRIGFSSYSLPTFG